jgi:hypothetical protein
MFILQLAEPALQFGSSLILLGVDGSVEFFDQSPGLVSPRLG